MAFSVSCDSATLGVSSAGSDEISVGAAAGAGVGAGDLGGEFAVLVPLAMEGAVGVWPFNAGEST